MAFGITPARHVDELEPYRAQHRVLGLGITVGGLVTGVAGAGYFAPTGDVPATVAVASLGILVAVLGLLHMTVGARLYQARMAKRLLATRAATEVHAHPVEA